MSLVNADSDGILDTNVFLHAQSHDELSEECRRFLAAVEQGHLQTYLDPLVLHELSYSLPHYVKQITRDKIAEYLLGVLGWPGIQGEKDLMVEAVERWWRTPGLAFVDAYLAALARSRSCPVYTKNVREFATQGVHVPNPLPAE